MIQIQILYFTHFEDTIEVVLKFNKNIRVAVYTQKSGYITRMNKLFTQKNLPTNE